MTTSTEIEALLFATPDPIPFRTIADLAGTAEKAEASIDELRLFWKDRGAVLHESREGYRLVARADLLERKVGERQRELSEPAIAALAVIAFDRPVTKQDLDRRRGGKLSSSILKTIDPLITKRSRGGSGGGLEYAPSALLVSHLGATSADDLPSPSEAMALARASDSSETDA